MQKLRQEFARSFRKSRALYLPEAREDEAWAALSPLAHILSYLQTEGERNQEPWIITEHFTQWGSKACFESLRGTTGKRNYFSQSNGLFLDGVLRTVRKWWQNNFLTPQELFSVMTSVIEEVVITANVNGTFHDFNRNRLWPNALQPFCLRVPLLNLASQAVEITNDDALNAAGYVAHHDVCYLDPPYNFRQYSAYYHFLNFVSAIPVLGELEEYLEGIIHVRGQNPEDDQSSDFCGKSKFIGSLEKLVSRAPSDYVVLSYYNGRNHWNHWATVDQPTTEGLEKISALFADQSLFEDFEVVPALKLRQNYQSRAGEQKSLVNEYLFLGRKKKLEQKHTGSFVPLAANERWGIHEHFGHTVSAPNELTQTRSLARLA